MTDENARPSGNDRDIDQFAVRIKVARGQANELLRRGGLDFGDHPHITENADGTGMLDLFVSRSQIEALRAEGYEIEVGVNLSARGRERFSEVGKGDRFEGGRISPRGLGRKVGGDVRAPGQPKPGDGPKGAS